MWHSPKKRNYTQGNLILRIMKNRYFSCLFFLPLSPLLPLTLIKYFHWKWCSVQLFFWCIALIKNDALTTFLATGLFLYPLKILKNQRFSDVFWRYRKRSLAWNWSVTFLHALQCDIKSYKVTWNVKSSLLLLPKNRL